MNSITIKITGVCAAICVSALLSFSAHADGEYNRPAIWSGFYAGGSIGGAFSDFDKLEELFDESYSRPDEVNEFGTASFDGKKELDTLTGGLHIGYNHQSGKLVLGIEAGVDFLNAGLTGTNSEDFSLKDYQEEWSSKASFNIDYLASLRGRIGIATDKTLLYATAGVAWTTLKLKVEENFSNSAGRTEHEEFSQDEGLTGFVVGGGAEYMIGKNLSLRGEVLHYQFNVDMEEEGDKLETDISTTVGKVGVSYKF